jgi:DNA-binding protein HU-beta
MKGSTMNQAELVARITEVNSRSLAKADVQSVLTVLGEVAADELKKGGEVTLPGIGKLTTKARAARTGKNPQTGEPIVIPAKTVPHFSAAKALKDAVI